MSHMVSVLFQLSVFFLRTAIRRLQNLVSDCVLDGLISSYPVCYALHCGRAFWTSRCAVIYGSASETTAGV